MRPVAFCAYALALAGSVGAQEPSSSQPPKTPPPSVEWQYGGFVDLADLFDANSPSNHAFRNRSTTPRVDELGVNMAAIYLRRIASESSRIGMEVTAQTGNDTDTFGFSATAPNIRGADSLRHLGPTNLSYLAPVGKGLILQGGIFNSLIGYDSLYAKDNFTYTRPWAGDETPYLMLGVNGSYPLTPTLTITAGLVNGYSHLATANSVPSSVGQLAYKPADAFTVKETVLYGPQQADTSLRYWRIFSDTTVEQKRGHATIAFEYQLSAERMAAAGNPRALWMAAQLPVRWVVHAPLSVTVRPEIAWDRDGRWIVGSLGAGQSIRAVTSTLEYRFPYLGAQAIVRGEYRFDDSRGPGGGFFDDGSHQSGVPRLTPTQHLFVIALIVTFDGTFRP